MRHLLKLGVTAFDDQYTVNNVSAYLLSIRLRSTSTNPKDLSEFLHSSQRNAQRYIYNSNQRGGFCLRTAYGCLRYVGVSLEVFFKDVDMFLEHKYHAALYDLETNSLTFFTKEEYEERQYDVEVLKDTIVTRTKFVGKWGLDISRPHLGEIENTISKYPSHVIEETRNALVRD